MKRIRKNEAKCIEVDIRESIIDDSHLILLARAAASRRKSSFGTLWRSLALFGTSWRALALFGACLRFTRSFGFLDAF